MEKKDFNLTTILLWNFFNI